MVGVLRDLSPKALTHAIEWNLFGLYATFDRIPRAHVEHEPNLMRVLTGLQHEMLNGIFRAQLPPDDIDGATNEALKVFRAQDLPMIWWTGPSTRPHELGKYLENAGLIHTGDMTGAAVDLNTLPETVPVPEDLTVETVRDESTLRKWLAPLAFGYEFPEPAALALFELFHSFGYGPDAPFQHYLGRWKGHPIATCSMFLGAGVAGIHVTVVPTYRGQGIGVAMTLAPLLDARALGYRVGVSNLAPNGTDVHRLLGFKRYCELGVYMPRDWGGLEVATPGQLGDGIGKRPWVNRSI